MTTKKRIEDLDFETYCENIETSDLDDFDQVFAKNTRARKNDSGLDN